MESKEYEEAQMWIEHMIHHMYQTGDAVELENAFDELVGLWGLRLPEHPAKIQVKPGYIPHSKEYDLSTTIWNRGVEMMNKQTREGA